MRKHFPGQPRSRWNSTEIPPSRGNIFPYEHIFPARRGNLFCLWFILWRQRQSAIVLYQGRTSKFCLGGCQHVLDRLNFFGPTGCIQAVRTLEELWYKQYRLTEGAKRRGSGGKAPRKFFEDTPSTLAQNTSPDPMFVTSKHFQKEFLTFCDRFLHKLASSG